MDILLYTSVESACAQKVRLVLSEKKVDWNERSLNLRRGDQFAPEYLKLNPKAVVPTLVHGNQVIRESSVINEYLDEIFPDPPLKPSDPWLRS
ncbi:MAG: glutathione S-transferase N-terminal domain-containing protein, partial [Pseudomonadales bacterium]|nr:glutathione S-transferase N-terminal domain-containing protein [Pseudomonadales bacterium]